MRLQSFGATDRGLVRSENQDSFLADDAAHLYAVADGVGGLQGGAEASTTTVRLLRECLRNSRLESLDLPGLLKRISEAVAVLGKQIDPDFGIGTTLTLALVVSDTLKVAHVGDSALFRLRNQTIEKLTADHTVASDPQRRRDPLELTLWGEFHSHALTRCIGQKEPPEFDLAEHPIRPGDRFLLCTDGVTRMIPPTELEASLRASPEPQACVRQLIHEANERGGIDNATAVALYIEESL